MAQPIPLSRPDITQKEIDAVTDVMHGYTLSIGPRVEQFERQCAKVSGRRHAVAVSSGTAGLHCAMIAAGVGPGHEVITTPFSFVASANCILFEGATPVFADIDPRTLNLDPDAVEAAITEQTKAIVAVDIFGYPCELGELRRLADRYGLAFVEDACEALGARYRGRPLGSFSHPAVFAFYPNKQVTTGEGGAVAVQTQEEWRLVKSLANQGRADSGGWLEHARYGYNYRLDDLSAAVGLAQIERLDELLALRSAAAARYAELLREIAEASTLLADDADHRRSWFVYPVRLAAGIDRERVIARLTERGIATSRYLPSIHLQAYMRERFGYQEGMFPVAEEASRVLLSLPFFTNISAAQQERVVEELAAALR